MSIGALAITMPAMVERNLVVVAALEDADASHQRALGVVLQEDDGDQQVVPHIERIDDDERHKGGQRQRQDDLAQDEEIGPAPSMRADSKSSFGTVRKKVVSR